MPAIRRINPPSLLNPDLLDYLSVETYRVPFDNPEFVSATYGTRDVTSIIKKRYLDWRAANPGAQSWGFETTPEFWGFDPNPNVPKATVIAWKLPNGPGGRIGTGPDPSNNGWMWEDTIAYTGDLYNTLAVTDYSFITINGTCMQIYQRASPGWRDMGGPPILACYWYTWDYTHLLVQELALLRSGLNMDFYSVMDRFWNNTNCTNGIPQRDGWTNPTNYNFLKQCTIIWSWPTPGSPGIDTRGSTVTGNGLSWNTTVITDNDPITLPSTLNTFPLYGPAIQILAANWGGVDVTANLQAQVGPTGNGSRPEDDTSSTFPSQWDRTLGTLTINSPTMRSAPGWPADPWVNNNKVLAVMYQIQGGPRQLYVTADDWGSFTIDPKNRSAQLQTTGMKPDATQGAGNLFNVVAIVWGANTSNFTIPTSVYKTIADQGWFYPLDSFFGFDGWFMHAKTAQVFWTYGIDGPVRCTSAREYQNGEQDKVYLK